MRSAVAWVGISAAAVIVLFILDRRALWMERRGWIYYRKTKRRTGANLSNAFLEVEALIDPRKKHVLEIRREEKQDQADQGDPPDAAGRGDGSSLGR